MFSLSLDYSIIRNVVDVLTVAYLIYRVLLLIRGTRAVPMLAGLSLVVIVFVISKNIGFVTLDWLLGNFLSSIIIVVVILFQDELRRALTKVGLQRVLRKGNARNGKDGQGVIPELVSVSAKLSREKIGALIVIERDVGLEDLVEDSVTLDAVVSRKLLYSIFLKESPLHDGAVLVEGDRIKAAGCVLPLSFDPELDPNLGTRHRAALGISARSDALVIIVSEETGALSVAREGRLIRNLDSQQLQELLSKIITPVP